MPGALSPAPRPIPGTVDWQDAGHMRDCPVAIFIVTLRWYMEELPSEHTGWPAGARDPVVGAALVLLHRKPCHAWTIAGLASEVGTSRTVLTERFDRFLGSRPSPTWQAGGYSSRRGSCRPRKRLCSMSRPTSDTSPRPPSTVPSRASSLPPAQHRKSLNGNGQQTVWGHIVGRMHR